MTPFSIGVMETLGRLPVVPFGSLQSQFGMAGSVEQWKQYFGLIVVKGVAIPDQSQSRVSIPEAMPADVPGIPDALVQLNIRWREGCMLYVGRGHPKAKNLVFIFRLELVG